MMQPYLTGVDTAGETGLLMLEGNFDHAIGKEPMLLDGPSKADGDRAALPEVAARVPSAAELAVADATIAYVSERFGAVPLYARVDLLPTPEGPVLLELELTEPRLFLESSLGSAGRYAEAIRRAATTVESEARDV